MAEEQKFTTTFKQDFTTADAYGISGVQDTFNRAFNEWKGHYQYLTDLVIVLNHKIWEHYRLAVANRANEEAYKQHLELGYLYDQLWKQADAYACENLNDNELEYFYRTTD